jgi:C4-type Zn-finger protein
LSTLAAGIQDFHSETFKGISVLFTKTPQGTNSSVLKGVHSQIKLKSLSIKIGPGTTSSGAITGPHGREGQ